MKNSARGHISTAVRACATLPGSTGTPGHRYEPRPADFTLGTPNEIKYENERKIHSARSPARWPRPARLSQMHGLGRHRNGVDRPRRMARLDVAAVARRRGGSGERQLQFRADQ